MFSKHNYSRKISTC